MPRRPNPVPTYRLHGQSGQAIVTIRLAGGERRDILLGKYDSPESKAEYERVLAEVRATATTGVNIPIGRPGPAATVNEVLLAYMRFAAERYGGHGSKPPRELTEHRQCVRAVREVYGHTPAKEFGPLALKAVRQRMIDGGLCRRVVNLRVGRIKRMFKWAASEELVPAAVFQSLTTVAGLQRGQAGVRETAPVRPVSDELVAATLPHLPPVVAAMAEVQRLTGMRPGEVCRLRPADVDRTGPVWLYRPAQHKTAWRGKARVIAIGPKAQAKLLPFWPADPTAHVFSPLRAVLDFRAARTAARKTPKYPSHMKRNAAKRAAAPKRVPSGRYTNMSYGYAIRRVCEKHGIESWSPNQLRHAHATEVRKAFGLEAAGASLGHSKLSVTEVYAERDLALALRVAAEAG